MGHQPANTSLGYASKEVNTGIIHQQLAKQATLDEHEKHQYSLDDAREQ